MKVPKISLGSWAFAFGPFRSNPWPFARFLSYAASAGYDGVEINGFRPHPHPDDYATSARCRELVRSITDLGLGISGYAPDFTAAPPSQLDPKEYLAAFEKSLKFCEHCGIRILRVDSVDPPVELPPQEYQKRFSRLAATWHAAAERARRSGIRLVWEFEPGFWLNKPSEVKKLHETVAHRNFALLFDTSHAYMGAVVGARQTGDRETLPGGVAEYARLVEDAIGHFHLIDSDGTLHDNETSTHTPFGKGKIDFRQVLQAMRRTVDRLDWWCVDFCFCPTTETDAQAAIPYIKRIVKELS